MALYVVRVPDPAPGTDWETMVPGQYLYNVTGITANLTPNVPAAGVIADATPNGHDGSYDGQPVFVTGVALPDAGASMGDIPPNPPATFGAIDLPPDAIDPTGSVTAMWWFRRTPGDTLTTPVVLYGFKPAGTIRWQCRLEETAPAVFRMLITNGNYNARRDAAPLPDDGNWHLLGFEYNAVTQHGALYVDGTPLALTVDTAGPANVATLDVISYGRSSIFAPVLHADVDEMALFNARLGPAVHAAIYAAAANGFASYQATVLAQGPATYYHFSSPGLLGGRQVGLRVTDGTTEVGLFGSGFPVSYGPPPFRYSWSPTASSNSQSSTGSITTVAVPPLVIPAGYTVGTFTADLAAADQWSNIALWWSDDVQRSEDPNLRYQYPPGALLEYHQIGTQP